jgi:hypothetical protein
VPLDKPSARFRLTPDFGSPPISADKVGRGEAAQQVAPDIDGLPVVHAAPDSLRRSQPTCCHRRRRPLIDDGLADRPAAAPAYDRLPLRVGSTVPGRCLTTSLRNDTSTASWFRAAGKPNPSMLAHRNEYNRMAPAVGRSRIHLRPSAFICVHLRLIFLAVPQSRPAASPEHAPRITA